MIVFKKIKYKNFLSTGNIPIEIDLNKSHTTLIVGSNGSGKSTLLDALCFVLFNKPFRPISKSQLINSINLSGTVVELEFHIQKNKFKIIRGIKPNIFEIYCNGKMLNQEASNNDYQKILEQQILKLNYRSFTQVVILGSSTFIPFMQLKTRDRREVVEDILDIKIFSLMNFLLKHKVKEVSEELKSIEYEFSLTKDKINLQQKYIEDIKKNKEKIVTEKQIEVNDSLKLIEQQNKDILKLQEDMKPLDEALKDKDAILKSVKEFNKMEAKLSNRVDENERQRKFFSENDGCPTCTQTIEKDLKEKKIKEKTNRILELKEGITKLEQELNEKEKRLSELSLVGTAMRAKEVDIAKATASISQLKKFIEHANNQLQ